MIDARTHGAARKENREENKCMIDTRTHGREEGAKSRHDEDHLQNPPLLEGGPCDRNNVSRGRRIRKREKEENQSINDVGACAMKKTE